MKREGYIMASLYCSKCGSEVNDKASFCHKCGSPIMVPVDLKKPEKDIPKKKISKKVYFTIGILVIIIIAVVIGIVLVNKPDTKGYYGKARWGMTSEQVKKMLGKGVKTNTSDESLYVEYSDYEGIVNMNAMVDYIFTDDLLTSINIEIVNKNENYKTRTLFDEYWENFDKQYGKGEAYLIFYTWKTDKSKITMTFPLADDISLRYQDITTVKE